MEKPTGRFLLSDIPVHLSGQWERCSSAQKGLENDMNWDYNKRAEKQPDPGQDPVQLLFSYIVQYSEPPPEQKDLILRRILAALHT